MTSKNTAALYKIITQVVQMEKTHFSQAEIIEKIRAKKQELGRELLILAHHYQRKEIVALGDFVGDSLSWPKTPQPIGTAVISCFAVSTSWRKAPRFSPRPIRSFRFPTLKPDAGWPAWLKPKR